MTTTTTHRHLASIWNRAVIVLDTNVIYNLYQPSAAARDDLLGAMEANKDKLWMPYQVRLEYFSTRLNNKSLTMIHEALKTKMEEGEQTASDTILNKVLTLYHGRIGQDFTPEELLGIYEEGKRRYAKYRPPGYKDAKQKWGRGMRYLYGDLIIWKELIRYSKQNNVDIIFVTNDKKDDWWDNTDYKTAPRIELLREFHKKTKGHTLLMYQLQGFIENAKRLS